MSWDGIYVRDRHYPIFEVGDEVIATKKFKALTKDRGYIVVNFISKWNYNKLIVLINDIGIECSYASYHFKKSDNQIAMDKRDQNIKLLLNESDNA
jgi:hypothetical protein